MHQRTLGHCVRLLICIVLLFSEMARAQSFAERPAKPSTGSTTRLAPPAIHTDFAGGSLGRIEQVATNHFRCAVLGERDQDGRNRQASWYFFRVDGARGKALTIDLVELAGEYNYRPNRGAITGITPPWLSEDGRNWQPLQTTQYVADTPRLRLRFTPRTNRVWVAHVPPYTDEHLQRLLNEYKRERALQSQVIGKTVQGRNLLLLTVTDQAVPAQNKKVIWLMFRQHSWEAGSSWAGEGALRFLLSRDPQAVQMRRTAIFKILPLCDPDGVARGGVRFNAHGFDLNRNWDVRDENKMPEIAAQRKAIFDWLDNGQRVDLFVTLHNTETSEYLEGPPAFGADKDRYSQLMERFFKQLSANATFAPTRPASFAETTTTAGKPGRMTAVQGLYNERRLPAFLIELMIAKHPKLGRQPTPDDRRQFGAHMAQAAWQAVAVP